MDEMWQDYFLETWGRYQLSHAYGFATYIIQNDSAWVIDVYIKPNFRGQRLASKFVDEIKLIAKEKNCKFLFSTVPIQSKTSHNSLIAQLKYGFKIHSANHAAITLFMEIN